MSEENNKLLAKGKYVDPDDQGPSENLDPSEDDQNQSRYELKVPDRLDCCQWAVIAILYVILIYLIAFIVYISATWNKDRTNEYT